MSGTDSVSRTRAKTDRWWIWVRRGTFGLPALSVVWSLVTTIIFLDDPRHEDSIERAVWVQAWIGLSGSAFGMLNWFAPRRSPSEPAVVDGTPREGGRFKRVRAVARRFFGKLAPVLGILAAIWAYIWILLFAVVYSAFALLWSLAHGLAPTN
jgi:hypothetical protein